MLINLVGNALDATGQDGSVRIGTNVVDGADGRYAVLRVSDDGAGIDEDTRPHIFEPYFTTKRQEGTGLGLAIVHALVERAGGYIRSTPRPARARASRSTCRSSSRITQDQTGIRRAGVGRRTRPSPRNRRRDQPTERQVGSQGGSPLRQKRGEAALAVDPG